MFDQLSIADQAAMIAANSSAPRPTSVGEPWRPSFSHGPAEISLQKCLDRVADNFSKNHAFAQIVIATLGGHDAIYATKPKPKPTTLDPLKVWAIELSIGKGKPGKIKKPTAPKRWDQASLENTIQIKCWLEGSAADFENPDWVAEAQLRSPRRADKDKSKKSRAKGATGAYAPQMSEEYQQWLTDQIIPTATEQGYEIGFLYAQDRNEYAGTHWYEQHVILVPASVLTDPTSTDRAVLVTPTGAIALPPFRNTTSTGKALGGTYFRQSRGTREKKIFRGWVAGNLQFL